MSLNKPLHMTFLTSQACMAASIDTHNAPARFIGHICWDTRKGVYVPPFFAKPVPIPIKTLSGYGCG